MVCSSIQSKKGGRVRTLSVILSGIVLLTALAVYAEDAPTHIMVVIKERAAREHPYDYNSREHAIERQKNAYFEIRDCNSDGISEVLLRRIKGKAASECPHNYCAQKYLIDVQIRDFFYIQNYSAEDVPEVVLEEVRKRAAREFPDDYSSQKLVIEDQITEYLDQ